MINKALTQNVLTNPIISWKAKGLFIFILNHPEVFKEIRTNKDKFLLKHGKEGPDALRSGLKELRQNNFLHSEFHRNTESGRNYIIGTTWTLSGGK